MMPQGSKLRKYGRRGKPKDHYFRLSPDDRELQWESSNVSDSISHVKHQSNCMSGVSGAQALPAAQPANVEMLHDGGVVPATVP